jgi:hypothetical protein
MPIHAPRQTQPASEAQRAKIARLAPLRLRAPQYTLARLDLYTSGEARRLIDHLLDMPDLPVEG